MRHAVIVLAVVSCLGVFSLAQTADELVNKNIQAKGGVDKIKAIKSVRITGKLSGGGGFTAAVVQENQRSNLVRETFALQGMTAVTAYDGTTGWQIQPFGGHKDPELMGEDDMKDLLLDADFDGPLVDYKEKGNTVEFLGHDVVDGDDALRLKVTLKDGDIVYYYLDPDTYLEIRKEVQEFIRGSVRESVIEMGSYKPVAGVMYPYSISQGSKANPSQQTTTVEKIEVNVPIDPSDFAEALSQTDQQQQRTNAPSDAEHGQERAQLMRPESPEGLPDDIEDKAHATEPLYGARDRVVARSSCWFCRSFAEIGNILLGRTDRRFV